MSNTQSNDSLRELNAKLLAEIGELRKKFAEIKVENDELKDKNTEIPELRRKFAEIETERTELKTKIAELLKQGMILEYTMIEPCRTLLKFFEKFHRTVIQISFLGDHM